MFGTLENRLWACCEAGGALGDFEGVWEFWGTVGSRLRSYSSSLRNLQNEFNASGSEVGQRLL